MQIDYYQVADILTTTLNRKIAYKNPSWIKFRHVMLHVRKLDKKMTTVMIMLYFMTRLGTASAVHQDFQKITGKIPRAFSDFARDNIQAWL